MARRYDYFKSDGVFVPRWVFSVAILVILFWFGLRILVPPSWIEQRLDSPDGSKRAELLRSRYLHDNLLIHVRSGWIWQTLYRSQAITNDYRVDLFERLAWSTNSNRLFLSVRHRLVWGYDFKLARDLHYDELLRAEPQVLQSRLH